MNEGSVREESESIIPMLRSDIIGVVLFGAVIGIFVWGIGALLNRFVFDPVLCQGDTVSQCVNAKNYAALIASVLGLIVALFGLIRLRVYRPLLVLIASLVSLWGIAQLSWELGIYTGLLIVVILYALAFGAFTWIARVREFWITLGLTIALTLIVRLAFAL